ncbi:hypothetical protein EDE08_101632 [Bradyrhizobium sp. R2.2-H]|jgi:hypothetical protein|nr:MULTISPECIES: hypothetical protein [unclassified Bradyrhizobium]TCU78850.1 hypothetical protein EDE10_101633 [Bradyrhizobium sp. Y-H1]TCU80933.1 hypothetical protein EDE08_101632 [Bradyrhizobium sp. R2.2-H]
MKKKLYAIEKRLWATSIKDALKREKNTPPNDIYTDPDWRRNNTDKE